MPAVIYVEHPPQRVLREAENLTVSVPAAGNTQLLRIPTRGLSRVFVQFTVTSFALDAFQIQGKACNNASPVVLYSAAADFTSPNGMIIEASGDVTTQAAGSTGWALLDVKGLFEISFWASANGGTASVDIYAGGK